MRKQPLLPEAFHAERSKVSVASIRDHTSPTTQAGVSSRGALCSERLSPKPVAGERKTERDILRAAREREGVRETERDPEREREERQRECV